MQPSSRRRFAQSNNGGDDEYCADPSMRRLLIKKTWCHGQVVAAFQGGAYAYWGITSAFMAVGWRAFLISTAIILPTWTGVSWWAMHGRKALHGKVILGFGSCLLPLYASVLYVAFQPVSTGNTTEPEPFSDSVINILVIIATALQTMETLAFLSVVACLRNAIVDDKGEQEGLLGGV